MTEIDWKRKFEQQVTLNIEQKAAQGVRLAEAQLALDQAGHKVEELEELLRKAAPATKKLRETQAAAEDAAKTASETIKDLRDKVKRLETELARGQRGQIESVIGWLQKTAAKMPEPELPEPPGVVEEAVFS